MRSGSLVIMAKVIGELYCDRLSMTNFSSPKMPNRTRPSVNKIYYARSWDRRLEIYESKRRNMTRR